MVEKVESKNSQTFCKYPWDQKKCPLKSGDSLIMYELLTKGEIKIAGFWPSRLSVCLWIETKSRSTNTQKRMRRIYPAIKTEQACSRMLYKEKQNCFLVGHRG